MASSQNVSVSLFAFISLVGIAAVGVMCIGTHMMLREAKPVREDRQQLLEPPAVKAEAVPWCKPQEQEDW